VPRQTAPAAEGGGGREQEDHLAPRLRQSGTLYACLRSETLLPQPLHGTGQACHIHVVVLLVDMVCSGQQPGAGPCPEDPRDHADDDHRGRRELEAKSSSTSAPSRHPFCRSNALCRLACRQQIAPGLISQRVENVRIFREKMKGVISKTNNATCHSWNNLVLICTSRTSSCITSPPFSSCCMNLLASCKFMYDRC
jgi:hypothetical protein